MLAWSASIVCQAHDVRTKAATIGTLAAMAADDLRVDILLAPGASGGPASMRAYVDGLKQRGLLARSLHLPNGRAERAVPAYRKVAAQHRDAVLGGQSFGGRVATLLAAEQPVRALVLTCFPLHLPGRPDMWEERTAHFPQVACPVLLLSGDQDPRARADLLRRAVERLPQATLHLYPGVGHGLRPVLPDALDRIAAFVNALA
jgi:predicted alpha/beta-hydrolase family hydrolase